MQRIHHIAVVHQFVDFKLAAKVAATSNSTFAGFARDRKETVDVAADSPLLTAILDKNRKTSEAIEQAASWLTTQIKTATDEGKHVGLTLEANFGESGTENTAFIASVAKLIATHSASVAYLSLKTTTAGARDNATAILMANGINLHLLALPKRATAKASPKTAMGTGATPPPLTIDTDINNSLETKLLSPEPTSATTKAHILEEVKVPSSLREKEPAQAAVLATERLPAEMGAIARSLRISISTIPTTPVPYPVSAAMTSRNAISPQVALGILSPLSASPLSTKSDKSSQNNSEDDSVIDVVSPVTAGLTELRFS